MSASLNNAGLELIKEEAAPAPREFRTPSPTDCLGHEALQALLAFSALHEQIRTRRARQMRDGVDSNPQDDWQVEQFVLDEVLQLVAARALAITGADGVAIALAEGDAIVCRASAGSIVPEAGVRLDPNAGFSGECLVSGRIVRCDDADTDPRVNLQACRRLGVCSMLAVPLSAKQTVVGLLEAFSSEPFGFNDSDVRSLSLLAELILSAMKPEEEDRLSEISRRVVGAAAAKPKPADVIAPLAPVQIETPPENPGQSLEPSSSEPSSGKSSEEKSIGHLELVVEGNPKSSRHSVALEEQQGFDRSRPGLAVVAAVVLFATALGAGVWWILGHRGHTVRANASSNASAAAQQAVQPLAVISKPIAAAPPAVTQAVKETEQDEDSDVSPSTPEEAGLLPQVTGIRHWSSADSSTVVIDIQDQVQYEAHRLPNPERIYFDLHDTTLAAALSNRIIAVNDALLQRVRVAQPMAGVTRVVLETSGASDFSVSLEPNPYRLVVEVRKLGTKPGTRAKIDLFAPTNPVPSHQVAAPQPSVVLDSIPSKQSEPSSPAVGGNEKRPASLAPLDVGQTRAPLYPPKLRIVLDAGHGGWDMGGVGRQGLLEKIWCSTSYSVLAA